MRAVVIEQYGGPEVLQHRDDLAVPTPGPGDVLVQVARAGINFMDVHTRQGKYKNSRTYPVRLPCTLGMEASPGPREVSRGREGTLGQRDQGRGAIRRLTCGKRGRATEPARREGFSA